MRDPLGSDIAWIAQRHGQDWRDDAILAATDWLERLVPSAEWERRIASVEAQFQTAKANWAEVTAAHSLIRKTVSLGTSIRRDATPIPNFAQITFCPVVTESCR